MSGPEHGSAMATGHLIGHLNEITRLPRLYTMDLPQLLDVLGRQLDKDATSEVFHSALVAVPRIGRAQLDDFFWDHLLVYVRTYATIDGG